MNFNKTLTSLALAVIAILSPQTASADVLLSFSADNGATFSNSFDIATGDGLTVGVFVVQSAPDTILSDEGLLGFALVAETSPTNLGAITAASIDAAFDTASDETFTASTIDWRALAFASPPIGPAISLGQFRFDSTATGATTFTFSDRAPGTSSAETEWLSAGTGTALDEEIFGAGATGNFQLTINSVSAIPEPSACFVLLFSSVTVMLRRKRSS